MKNFGLLILGIILGALAMYFYCCNNEDLTTGSPPNVKPVGLISPSEAKVLDQAYNIKHRIISDSLFKNDKTKDNRSTWWPIDDIKDYIDYADYQVGELGYTLDGLRVYIGSYPNSNSETGLTTMFIIPTGSKNTAEGNLFPLQFGSSDVPGGNGLNMGGHGNPPGGNYPQ